MNMETEDKKTGRFKRALKNEYVILGLFCIAVFVLHVYTVGKFYTFTIWDDEFCYWSSASFLAGMDWSSAMSTAAYYSYGSSLLLLPLMWLFSNSITLYRAALILNGVMLTCIVPLAYSIGKHHYPNVNRILLIIISFCVSMLPAYYIQSSMTMAESALYLVFWLVVWLFNRMDKHSGYWIFIVLGVLLPYTYMIHQRSIGIVVAAFIALIYMGWKKHVAWKQIAAFALVCIVMFAIHSWIKPKIQSELWLNSGQVKGNDYATQLIKIGNLITFEGFIKFLQVCCGQLFYIGATTLSMAFIGFGNIFQRGYFALFRKNDENQSDKQRAQSGLWLFVILAVLATFAISCVFMYFSPTKADHVIYGRYNEVFVGPLLLFGLLGIMQKKRKLMWKMAICSILLITTGMIAKYTIEQWGLTEYNLFCIPGFTLTRHFPGNRLITAILGAVVGTGLMLFLANIGQRQYPARIAAVGLLSCFFILSGLSLTSMAIASQIIYNAAADALSYIRIMDNEIPVYFLLNDEPYNNSRRGHLQFMMMDKPLICVNEANLLEYTREKFVIQRDLSADTDDINFYTEMMKNYSLCYNNGEYRIWISKQTGCGLDADVLNEYSGGTLEFSSGNPDYRSFVLSGLSNAESEYAWSCQEEVYFYFSGAGITGQRMLKATISPFLYGDNDRQTITVMADGVIIAKWEVTIRGEYTATIPQEMTNDGKLMLTFTISNPKSPLELGLSQDSRLLGLQFYQMSIDGIEASRDTE